MQPLYALRLTSIAAAFALIASCSDRSGTQPAANPSAAAGAAVAKVPGDFELPNHSDENWVNGVANNWGAAYFVMLAPGVQEAMAVGNEVSFADGSKRTIQSAKVNGGTLIVNLDGPPLDGKVVGHPNKVRVAKPSK
ncbi:MAG: hypothetical protein ACK54C_15255 [Betaproteobacteria bacterium]